MRYKMLISVLLNQLSVGKPNQEYIKAELEWYKSMSRSVNDLADIYGKRVKIWDLVADADGIINSNYGWCVFSEENDFQYFNVYKKLKKDPNHRQAVMIYTAPDMHTRAIENGRHDFMCTNTVQYFINDGYLECQVNMRSNDAIYGFNNDVAWQREVLFSLSKDLGCTAGSIFWSVGSLHIYERHWDLIK